MPTTAPWPPTDPGQRQRLLAHLAHEYFVEGTSKIALGKKSGLSRFQVAALLQEAQDTGIVRIEIAVPLENSDEDLARTAGLQRLVTVGSTQWPADREALAKAVAREITRVLHDDDVLGISCPAPCSSWSMTYPRCRTTTSSNSREPSAPTTARRSRHGCSRPCAVARSGRYGHRSWWNRPIRSRSPARSN